MLGHIPSDIISYLNECDGYGDRCFLTSPLAETSDLLRAKGQKHICLLALYLLSLVLMPLVSTDIYNRILTLFIHSSKCKHQACI